MTWRNGFTLLEMLIVLGMVATLAVLAVPGYLQPMSRVEATRAGGCLLALASRLEQHRLSADDYAGFDIARAGVACQEGLADRYRFEAGVPGTPDWGGQTADPIAWQLRVRPVQAGRTMAGKPACRALVVRDDGRRGVMRDPAGEVVTDPAIIRRCWR
jgi:type IV pilus assembly protein PilE